MNSAAIALVAIAVAVDARAQNAYSVGTGPQAPAAGLFGGKLPSNEPGAGNYFVGGPSDAYRGVVRDLEAQPRTVDQFSDLQKRIDALQRADLGDKPYDVKLGLQLRLLELEWSAESVLKQEAASNKDGATNFSGYPGPSPARLEEISKARATLSATRERELAILEVRRRAEISLPFWVKSSFSSLDVPRVSALVLRYRIEDRFQKELLSTISGLKPGQPILATSTLSPRATLVVTGISDSPVRGVADPPIIVSLRVDAKTDGVMVRQVRVTNALDDQDRSLMLTAPNGVSRPMPMLVLPSLTAMYRAANKDEPTPLGGSVNVKTPVPGARAIKLLEGEMEIYAPTIANGGVTEISDFAIQVGHPIDDSLLKEAGIEIMPVNAETYAGLQEKLTFRGPVGFTPLYNLNAAGAMIYVDDPKGHLAGILFKGPDGRFIDMIGSEGRPIVGGGTLTLYKTPRAIPAGSKLIAYVNSTDATLVIPFRFENIPVQR